MEQISCVHIAFAKVLARCRVGQTSESVLTEKWSFMGAAMFLSRHVR